jgi:hypothetical protein
MSVQLQLCEELSSQHLGPYDPLVVSEFIENDLGDMQNILRSVAKSGNPFYIKFF